MHLYSGLREMILCGNTQRQHISFLSHTTYLVGTLHHSITPSSLCTLHRYL